MDKDDEVIALMVPLYPTPWRALAHPAAERLVVDATGSQVCEAETRQAAEAIVLAVNTFAGVTK